MDFVQIFCLHFNEGLVIIIAYIKGLLHGHHLCDALQQPYFYFMNMHKRQIFKKECRFRFDTFFSLFYRHKLAAVRKGNSFSAKSTVSAVGRAVINGVSVRNNIREGTVCVNDRCYITVGGDVPFRCFVKCNSNISRIFTVYRSGE